MTALRADQLVVEVAAIDAGLSAAATAATAATATATAALRTPAQRLCTLRTGSNHLPGAALTVAAGLIAAA